MNNTMKFLIENINKGERLDVFLTKKIKNLSRSQIKKIIESKNIRINKKIINSPSKKN